MEKMKVVFVVLHYCQINVTLDCINSLLNLNGNPRIVVVDNASPDGSGKLLEERYGKTNRVHVILNDSNLGFASANNIGYLYAKSELGGNIIVVINNDTLITDEEFVNKLIKSDLLSKYHIIAPDIINKDGLHQNPKAKQPPKYDKIVKNYKKAKLNRFLYSIPIIGNLKALQVSPPKFNNVKQEGFCEMIVPHGAAVIYTPLWVNKEDIAFCPGTFMYVEETLLYYYILNKHYKTVYCPDYKITHLEDVSTNSRFKNGRKKALFQINNSIHSHEILIDFIDKNKLK